MKKLKGFTLVELLVVVAIISAGVPAAAVTQECQGIGQTRDVRNNMKTLLSGAQLYAGSYRGMLPPYFYYEAMENPDVGGAVVAEEGLIGEYNFMDRPAYTTLTYHYDYRKQDDPNTTNIDESQWYKPFNLAHAYESKQISSGDAFWCPSQPADLLSAKYGRSFYEEGEFGQFMPFNKDAAPGGGSRDAFVRSSYMWNPHVKVYLPGNPANKVVGFYRSYERMDDFPADKVALVEVLFEYACAHLDPDPSWNTGWIDGHVKLISNPPLYQAQKQIAASRTGVDPFYEYWMKTPLSRDNDNANLKTAIEVLTDQKGADAFWQ